MDKGGGGGGDGRQAEQFCILSESGGASLSRQAAQQPIRHSPQIVGSIPFNVYLPAPPQIENFSSLAKLSSSTK